MKKTKIAGLVLVFCVVLVGIAGYLGNAFVSPNIEEQNMWFTIVGIVCVFSAVAEGIRWRMT